jgi:hypothetical protein
MGAIGFIFGMGSIRFKVSRRSVRNFQRSVPLSSLVCYSFPVRDFHSLLLAPFQCRKKAPGCGKNEAEHAFVSGLLASNLLD